MGGAASPKISTMLPNVSLFDCEAHDLLYEGLQGHEKKSLFSQKMSYQYQSSVMVNKRPSKTFTRKRPGFTTLTMLL